MDDQAINTMMTASFGTGMSFAYRSVCLQEEWAIHSLTTRRGMTSYFARLALTALSTCKLKLLRKLVKVVNKLSPTPEDPYLLLRTSMLSIDLSPISSMT
jgi:hypothetical protein